MASMRALSISDLVQAKVVYGRPGDHIRIGLPLLLLVVVAAIVVVVLLSRRRRDQHSDQASDHWASASPEQGGEASPAPASVEVGSVETRAPMAANHQAVGAEPEARRPRRLRGGGAADSWAVEVHGLKKKFGANVAVDDVDLESHADRRSVTSDRTEQARRR